MFVRIYVLNRRRKKKKTITREQKVKVQGRKNMNIGVPSDGGPKDINIAASPELFFQENKSFH